MHNQIRLFLRKALASDDANMHLKMFDFFFRMRKPRPYDEYLEIVRGRSLIEGRVEPIPSESDLSLLIVLHTNLPLGAKQVIEKTISVNLGRGA